jgi:glycosyltransferase involved in cell wall biosynthesis
VKIVMLVDNGVEGDSRVQKTARSAAEAGWDVTLLGLGPHQRWTIGDAEVRLVPLPESRPSTGIKAKVLAKGGVALRAARLARRPWEYARTWYHLTRDGNQAWRALEPGLWNYERAMGPTIDELQPDLIYANDFRMLGVGARAKERAVAAGRPVKLIWDVHEFLPGIKPRRDNRYWLPAHCAYEREYARYADAVVTVSPMHAELMQREHNLPDLPEVVLNAPDMTAADAGEVPDLRKLCGVGERTPLIVYSGSTSIQRGLDTVVDALPLLDGVHLAIVAEDPQAPHIQALTSRSDRVHAVPYVPYWQVVPFLSTADAGIIPIHHWPNHELALITKFFEYAHARLPIVVSDVKTMAAMVRRTGQGEVFRARDVEDFAVAVGKVLADTQRYRDAYDDIPLQEWTWAAQSSKLNEIYRRLDPSK